MLFSTLALAFISNGDYLVIGALEDKTTIATCFFGFQLTAAVLTMFTRTVRSVFIPSFVALDHDHERQERTFLRSLEATSMILFCILFGIAAIAQPAVFLMWSGKWHAAVPVIEIIALASLARVVSPIA